MSRSISFSVPDDIYEAIEFAASAKWKSPSDYVKDATAAYLKKYPPNGILAQIVRSRANDPKIMTADSDSPALPDADHTDEEGL